MSGSTSDTLKGLQAPDQRKVLDVIDKLRQLGLDSQLSLPQLVVCGDQSAGKSSVLEALTEISFPRADNLCTRFATEIIMRRGPVDRVTVKIIPDELSLPAAKENMKKFHDTITDLPDVTNKLASVIERAKTAMGINDTDQSGRVKTFSLDRLSIEIEGPSRIHLTVVDLPGLIQNESQEGDRALVDQLTKTYISQPRTICLCVLTASNDADNQRILTMVKDFDKDGDRSLGIITKPDTLPPGSGSESAYIDLAKNLHQRYCFKLGWHVLKNRSFQQSAVSFAERNRLEREWFDKSNFKQLPRSCLGIDTLRSRLSVILFDHIKSELPAIRAEIKRLLDERIQQQKNLGGSRCQPEECREYLVKASEDVSKVTEQASNGNYHGRFFNKRQFTPFDIDNPETLHRLRAAIQHYNHQFHESILDKGHKYHFITKNTQAGSRDSTADTRRSATYTCTPEEDCFETLSKQQNTPIVISPDVALLWVSEMITQNRGRELVGSYNPLVVSSLFWAQSERWEQLAKDHIQGIYSICELFLKDLVSFHVASDVYGKVWSTLIEGQLSKRLDQAYAALEQLMSDHYDHPINYDHYYSDTKQKMQEDRRELEIDAILDQCTRDRQIVHNNRGSPETVLTVDRDKLKLLLSQQIDRNMTRLACQEALDEMRAIYKVQLKSFVHGITSRVVEGTLVRGLENIFSPNVVANLNDDSIVKLVKEPFGSAEERAHIKEQITLLQHGMNILG